MVILGPNIFLMVCCIMSVIVIIVNSSFKAPDNENQHVRTKRRVFMRRIRVRNEMGESYPPVYTYCKNDENSDRTYLTASANLTNGEELRFTIYDVDEASFTCNVVLNGTEKSFYGYDGSNSKKPNIIVMRPSGLFRENPRMEPEKIDWCENWC